MLAAVSGTPEERVVACLSEALAAGLVTELSADDFAFRHALTREAVYEIVIGWERRRLHRVIAEVLDRAELDGPATRAARSDHWYRAEVWDRALDSALDAAASALERSAPGAAAELFDRAEEAARRFDVEVPLPLLRGRGRALEMLGAFERSRADLEAAARRAAAAGDAVLTSETQLDLGWLWSSRDYGRAGDHFRSALAVARDSGDDVTLARTLNRVGNWHLVSEQPLDALSRHDEALGLFRRARDERGIAQSLDLMATVELTLGDAGGASRSYLAALDRFRALDDKQGMASSLVMLTFCGPQYLNGPNGAPGPGVAERLAWGDEGLRLTQSIAWRSGQVVAMLGLASVLGYHGKLSDALAHAERATSQAEEIDHQYWRTLGHLIVGAVHLDTLAVERALPSLETAFRLAQQAGSLYWSRITAGFLVPTLLGSGQSERAREIVAVVGGGPDDEPPTDTRGMTMGQRHAWLACAELALADGAAERALAITTALEPPPGSAPLALLDLRGRILEALDRPDDALAVWQRALASARGAGVLSQVWRFEARMSRALRRAGRRAEAAEHLGAAWAVLDRLAAELPAAESNRFTRAARAGVPTTTEREQRKERFDGLTDREREVAVWVARGATNAEIARALSVSSRTVEKHVEHAMAKLGVSSRVRLASWALGHPADDGKGT
jgi:DNA-binding CsgD family transcriptional regulator